MLATNYCLIYQPWLLLKVSGWGVSVSVIFCWICVILWCCVRCTPLWRMVFLSNIAWWRTCEQAWMYPIVHRFFSLVMAYPESFILKSERRWMTAVIKPCHEKRKERKKQRYCRSIQTDRYLLVLWAFCWWCLSLPFLTNWIESVLRLSQCSQVSYAYSQTSSNNHGEICSSKQAGGLVVEELRTEQS